MKAMERQFDCNFYSFAYRPETFDLEVVVWVNGALPRFIPELGGDGNGIWECEDYDAFSKAVQQYMEGTGLEWGFIPFADCYEV